MLENFSVKNWRNGIHGLGVEISSDCNLRCKYCYYYRGASCSDILTDEQFFGNIDNVLDKVFEDFVNLQNIDFWGAEPLLHIKRIHHVVDKVIDSGKYKEFTFLISSNMAHEKPVYDQLFEMFDKLEKKLADKDMTIRFDIQSSIDFPKKVHNMFRVGVSGKNTYSTVRHNYTSLIKKIGQKNYRKVHLSIFTKSTYNYKELDLKTIQEAPDYIYDEIFKDLPIIGEAQKKSNTFNFNIDYFPTPATGIDYTLDDGLKNYAFYQSTFDNFEQYFAEGKLTYANAMFFLPGNFRIFISDLLCLPAIEKYQYPVCRSGVSFIGVKINGDIYPCHHFFTVPSRENFIIGNLFTDKYNEEMLLIMLNTYYLLSETAIDFENKVFRPKYSKNLNYGSLSNISSNFYRLILRHICFAENCEFKGQWDKLDIDPILRLYPAQWLELCLKFISKYRRVFDAIADKQFYATYGLNKVNG